MSGWIRLKRDILDHWIAQDNEYLAVWIRMLAEANFEDRKAVFNGAFVEVKRGQLIFGLDSYSDKTGVSVRRLRTLLELLEKDRMIDRQKTSKYSVISILNYEKHQSADTQDALERQAGDRLATSWRQAGDNTKRSKESEEGKEPKKKKLDLDFSAWPQIPDPVILQAWLDMRKRVKASVSQVAMNTIGKELINAVEVGLTVNECLEIAESAGWKGLQTEWVLTARKKYATQQTGVNTNLNRGERLQQWAVDATAEFKRQLAEIEQQESAGNFSYGDGEFIACPPDVDS